MRGVLHACDRALAVMTPTRSEPISPGPAVTAIRSISFAGSFMHASSSTSSRRGMIISWCILDASSGTTPPYSECDSIWLDNTEDNTIFLPFMTARAVSSQLVSIPRVRSSLGTVVIRIDLHRRNNCRPCSCRCCFSLVLPLCVSVSLSRTPDIFQQNFLK